MWSDKYAPRHVADILLDDYTHNKINKFITTKNIPNILVTGISGTGKTILLNCLAKDFYKKEIADYVFRLNSSIEKSIKLLQESMDSFCKQKIINIPAKKKMFIIDDIDNIPEKIQNIIALIMEKYPNNYYTFTCNSTSSVSELIQSRCLMLHIQRPTYEHISLHLKNICKQEKCKYAEDAIERICFISQGDVRLAINNLQLLCNSFGEVTLENIDKICDVPNMVLIQKIITYCMKNDAVNALKDGIKLYNDGYESSDILGGIFDVLKMPTCKIPDDTKFKMLNVIGKVRYIICKKNDSLVQLERCIVKLCN